MFDEESHVAVLQPRLVGHGWLRHLAASQQIQVFVQTLITSCSVESFCKLFSVAAVQYKDYFTALRF